MALVPKSQYKGTITGKRKATTAEKRTLGATTYAPGVRRRFTPEHGPIQIVVTWEYFSKNLKKWIVSNNVTWEYKSLKAAIDYIIAYTKAKNAQPSSRMHGKPYFLTNNGRWVETTKKADGVKVHEVKDAKGNVRNMEFKPYDNPDWDNGTTLFAEYIVKGNYLRRVTFEQFKEVSTEWKRDYHDPAPDPWTHTATVTVTGKDGKTSKRTVRTINAADPEDSTQQKRNARRKEKRAIQREYDEHKMRELKMTPEEYALYKEDLHRMTDEEWQAAYGRNDTTVDYL